MKAVSILLFVLCSALYVNGAIRLTTSWVGSTCNGTLLGGSAIAPAFDCQPTITAATFTQYQCATTGLQSRTCTDSACSTGCTAYVAVAQCTANSPAVGFSIAQACVDSFAQVPTQTSLAGVVADFYASNATGCSTAAGAVQGYRIFGPQNTCIASPTGYAAGSSIRAVCAGTVPTISASRGNITCGGLPTTVSFATPATCVPDTISFFNNNWGVVARCTAALAPTTAPTVRPSTTGTNTTTGANTGTTTTSSAAVLFVSAFVVLASVFVAAL